MDYVAQFGISIAHCPIERSFRESEEHVFRGDAFYELRKGVRRGVRSSPAERRVAENEHGRVGWRLNAGSTIHAGVDNCDWLTDAFVLHAELGQA